MHDIRFALRALRATPIVSSVAILSLALGIGANTAIFSVVNSLMLRNLPVHEPERLVMLADTTQPSPAWSNPFWEQLREHQQLFDGSFAWASSGVNLARGGEAQIVDGLFASGGFFDVLGVAAVLGRTFTPVDDQRGGGPDGPVAVISYDFWRRRLGGMPDAIGQSLVLGSVPFTVVGVTPPRFFGPEVGRGFDVIVPIGTEPLLRGADSALNLRGRFWLRIMARLKAGQTIDSATAILRGIQPQIREATSPAPTPQGFNAYMANPFALVPAANGRSVLRDRFQQPLMILMGVVGLVLLSACANIANLLLARAAARRHEVSIRLALGSSRLQLVRQFLTESVLLSGIGAALGLAFASWTSRLLVRQLSMQTDVVFLDLTTDWPVLAFTSVVAAGTALMFGTAPALRATRVAPIEALREQGRGLSSGRSAIASTLVVVQVSLSLMLVVAAGLFVRTFVTLDTIGLGFDTDRLIVVSITPPPNQFKTEELTSLYERVREAASAVPGVERAAISDITPVSGSARTTPIEVSGGVSLPEGERTSFVNVISPQWLSTYRTALLAGRDIEDRDRMGAPRVAVVNEAFARHFLNGANPVGHTIGQGPSQIEIIGLATDAVYRSLRDPAPPTMYTAMAQRAVARPFVSLTVRASGASPGLLTRSLAAAIGEVNRDLVLQFRPLTEQVSSSLAQERLIAQLSSFFGILALVLAAVGLYGVTAYAVNQRRAEIGIRMALGAAPSHVLQLVLRRVVLLVAIGVAIGTIASLWAARFVAATLLYGVEARDPVTLIGAAAVLATVGSLAGWIPARRAARIDPAEVLRDT